MTPATSRILNPRHILSQIPSIYPILYPSAAAHVTRMGAETTVAFVQPVGARLPVPQLARGETPRDLAKRFRGATRGVNVHFSSIKHSYCGAAAPPHESRRRRWYCQSAPVDGDTMLQSPETNHNSRSEATTTLAFLQRTGCPLSSCHAFLQLVCKLQTTNNMFI